MHVGSSKVWIHEKKREVSIFQIKAGQDLRIRKDFRLRLCICFAKNVLFLDVQ